MSDDATPRLSLPYLAAGQMQKHVTLNEALALLDGLVQASVASRSTAAQPASPEEGAAYVLPEGATGADWALHPPGALLRYEAGAWTPLATPPGLVVHVADEDRLVVRGPSGWRPLGEVVGELQGLALLGLGTEADAANPFTCRLNSALWTARETAAGGAGDLRVAFNKEAAGNLVSLLFQSGYSGRLEVGLLGSDDATVKVSADGAAWTEALRIAADSGRVATPGGLDGGCWGEPVATWTWSGDVPAVDFTDLGGFRELLVVGTGLQHDDASSRSVLMRFSTDNGATYESTGYECYGQTGSSAVVLCASASNTAVFGFSAHVLDFNSAARPALAAVLGLQKDSSSAARPALGRRGVAQAYDALRVAVSGGQLKSGAITVYGRA